MASEQASERSHAFRTIAACIDAIEASDREVRDVSFTEGEVYAGESVEVRFVVTVPELSNLRRMGLTPDAEGLMVTNDGECLLEFSLDIPHNDALRSAGAGIDSLVDREEPFGILDQLHGPAAEEDEEYRRPSAPAPDVGTTGSEAGSIEASASEDATHEDSATGQEPQKAYRDPQRLQEVYETHETFQEMRDALGVDVTPQTVRRHMIKHGIHEVSTNPILDALRNASADQSNGRALSSRRARTGRQTAERPSESPSDQQPADSLDGKLPGRLTVEEVADAVSSARTVYEVQNQLNLSREPTIEVLNRFNLIDMVKGRAADSEDRSHSKADIEARMREAMAGEAHGQRADSST